MSKVPLLNSSKLVRSYLALVIFGNSLVQKFDDNC